MTEPNRAERRRAQRKAVRCDSCHAQVRVDRLARHMLRHGVQMTAEDVEAARSAA